MNLKETTLAPRTVPLSVGVSLRCEIWYLHGCKVDDAFLLGCAAVERKTSVSPKICYPLTSLHGVKTRKNKKALKMYINIILASSSVSPKCDFNFSFPDQTCVDIVYLHIRTIYSVCYVLLNLFSSRNFWWKIKIIIKTLILSRVNVPFSGHVMLVITISLVMIISNWFPWQQWRYSDSCETINYWRQTRTMWTNLWIENSKVNMQ
jgi:hypothetical protein